MHLLLAWLGRHGERDLRQRDSSMSNPARPRWWNGTGAQLSDLNDAQVTSRGHAAIRATFMADSLELRLVRNARRHATGNADEGLSGLLQCICCLRGLRLGGAELS